MTARVFLHVGLPKSGTSYLQKLLSANHDRLREHAQVLFPGDSWADQVLAVRDVRGIYDNRIRGRVEGRWQSLVEETLTWSGDAVISMEWLCAADDEQIARILQSFAGREPHVVLTARDLARTLPAAWQEFMQNRQTWTWGEFLAGVRDPEGTNSGGKAFWAQQDLPGIVTRWAGHLPGSQVHLVTLPQPGADRDLLWRRFSEVLGIEPEGYATHDLGGNESLGLESAELMRRVNLRIKDSGGPARSYNPNFKHRLAKEVLAQRRAEESSLSLPEEMQAWSIETAERHIDAVRQSGVDVVGDLSELRPTAPRHGRQPEQVSDSELLETAVAALVDLARLRGHQRSAGATPPTTPPAARQRVRAAVRTARSRFTRS